MMIRRADDSQCGYTILAGLAGTMSLPELTQSSFGMTELYPAVDMHSGGAYGRQGELAAY